MVVVDLMASKDTEYAAEVGARIVLARKEKALTQVELAELVGVSQRSMQAYENGEVIPYRKMRDIANVLERPVEFLLYGEGLFTAPDERLESIERSLDRLIAAVDRLSKKLG